jgi:hypothetical protein
MRSRPRWRHLASRVSKGSADFAALGSTRSGCCECCARVSQRVRYGTLSWYAEWRHAEGKAPCAPRSISASLLPSKRPRTKSVSCALRPSGWGMMSSSSTSTTASAVPRGVTSARRSIGCTRRQVGGRHTLGRESARGRGRRLRLVILDSIGGFERVEERALKLGKRRAVLRFVNPQLNLFRVPIARQATPGGVAAAVNSRHSFLLDQYPPSTTAYGSRYFGSSI